MFCLSKNATLEKFNNANGVVQRAIAAKRSMNGMGGGGMGGGGRNRGVSGMIRGGDRGRRKQRQIKQGGSSQEVAMARMGDWVGRDTPSIGYDDSSSYDSHQDRGRSSRRSDSRNRSRGRSTRPPVYKDDGYDDKRGSRDDSYDDMCDYGRGGRHDGGHGSGHDGGYDSGHGNDHNAERGDGYHKSAPRESIEEE